MDGCNYSVKKSSHMKELIAQADPSKEANTVKKMNYQSILLSSNKTTHSFKERMTAICFLKKKSILFTKIWSSNKILLAIQKLQYLERKLRLLVLRKNSSLKVTVPNVTLPSANVYIRSSKKFTILIILYYLIFI